MASGGLVASTLPTSESKQILGRLGLGHLDLFDVVGAGKSGRASTPALVLGPLFSLAVVADTVAAAIFGATVVDNDTVAAVTLGYVSTYVSTLPTVGAVPFGFKKPSRC